MRSFLHKAAVMNIDKFIFHASAQISSSAERKQFERELKCHIEDLTECFEDMGRKTFEETGHPLGGRENIVVSKSKKLFGRKSDNSNVTERSDCTFG